MKKDFRLALCQMKVTENRAENIEMALDMLDKAYFGCADIAVLPEMFICPYDILCFSEYAEKEKDSAAIKELSKKAAALGIYIIGGSIPEYDEGKIYNTCYIFDREGKVIGKHRKIHLFDVSVKDRISFMESEVLAAGNDITVIETEFCGIGIAICYDIRFPELSRIMALRGAELLIFPGAFNMVTGPAHWELLIRTRAVDNQVYIAAASPAKNMDASYTAYGNSMISDPWGEIMARAGAGEEVVTADISSDKINRIRNEMPLLKHRRTDIYQLFPTEK
jgi:omega-amidase